MSSSPESVEFSNEDFVEIEKAVRETARGRWFLDEFAARNKSADTATLLAAISRMEKNVTSSEANFRFALPELQAIAKAITTTASDISKVRNDMLDESSDFDASASVFAQVALQAKTDTADIISTAETLQRTVAGLREAGAPETHVDSVEDRANHLFSQGWRHDVLRQRVSMAMGLLEHLQHRFALLVPGGADVTDGADANNDAAADSNIETALSPENLAFFADDEDLFEEPRVTTQTETEKTPAVSLVEETVSVEEQFSSTVAESELEKVLKDIKLDAPEGEDSISSSTPCKPSDTLTDGESESGPADTIETTEESSSETVVEHHDLKEPEAKASDEDQQDDNVSSKTEEQTSDTDLSQPAAPDPAMQASEQEKERIIVIRRGSSTAMDIPFHDETVADEVVAPTETAAS